MGWATIELSCGFFFLLHTQYDMVENEKSSNPTLITRGDFLLPLFTLPLPSTALNFFKKILSREKYTK